MLEKNVIEFVQKKLSDRGFSPGPIDGDLGPKTEKALKNIDGLPSKWDRERKAVGFIQLLANEQELPVGIIDGKWGPNTAKVFKKLVALEKKPVLWRPEDVLIKASKKWPKQSQKELEKFYGPVGKNQTRIKLPFKHKLAWNLDVSISSFYCHEKVHDSLEKVLKRVLSEYGKNKISELRLDLWGGCLNVRKIRGGTRYSTHSWGISVDYDPTHNRLRWGRDKASFAKPEYDTWWRLWEEEGWISLGRLKNFDWMHVQAARL